MPEFFVILLVPFTIAFMAVTFVLAASSSGGSTMAARFPAASVGAPEDR